ncbi:CO6A4-like protein [Mya arenaria]|uniref:CO6A4-like protein n=1 Tax=Mya arenaria TaxID=6604 RepID=A0ABY7EU37_MYAAR|nr:CO6A4-like protein [Mya arenaria]
MKLLSVAFLAALAILARASAKKRQTTHTACIPQDIVYMVDSSSYVGTNNFLQELSFIKNNLRYYNLSPQCTRISVVTYSSGVYNQFYLNQYHSQQELYNAIDAIQYKAGGTNTGNVINWVNSNSFTAANGGRVGVPHYAVWVGGSSGANPSQTVEAAATARNAGMMFFSVGVGNGVNNGELRGMTGTCMQQADIAFLVDGSGSIGSTNFLKLENFVKDVVGKLDVGANKVHVSVTQFSNYPKQEFPLNMH